MSNIFDDDFDELDDVFASQERESEDHQTKIVAFDEQVERNIKILLSRKPAEDKRVEAAYWLGESGAPKAIYALRKIYRGEKSKRIKSAAAYALGQFKALDNAIEREKGESVSAALQREENAEIVQLLTAITLEGRIGKRKRIAPRTLVRVQISLVVSLVVLILLNVLLSGGKSQTNNSPQIAFNAEEQTAVDALNSLQATIGSIHNVSTILQTQYSADPATPDCTQPITTPSAVSLSIPEANPYYIDLFTFEGRINQQITDLQTSVELHTRICEENRQPTPEEREQISTSAGAITTAVTGIATNITTIRSAIETAAQARLNPSATPTMEQPTATATPEPSSTPTETPSPTPTLDPQLINQDVTAMSFVIDEVNAREGAYTLLNTFWTDVQAAGRTEGCRARTFPQVPEDYPPIDAELLAAAPELEQIREQINIGLGLLRQGWTLFIDSCNSDLLVQNLQTGLQIVATADLAFSNATDLLNALRRR